MPTLIPAGISFGNMPSVSGQDYTVSRLLKAPKIIERRLAEAIEPDYWMDRVFQSAGSAPSGAIITELWKPDLNALTRLEEELSEDSVVPLAGVEVGDILTLEASEHGIGYRVTRRHESRNQRWIMDRRERALAWTLAAGQNARGMTALNNAITTHNRTFAAPDWSAIVTDGAAPTPKEFWPHATIKLVRSRQAKDRIPFGYDTLIVDPLEAWRLSVIYDTDDLERALGLEQVIEDTTGKITQGSPTLVASTGLGGYVEEAATSVEVIDRPEKRDHLVQATGAGLYFVDNPYGALRLTGTAVSDLEA